VSSEHPSTRDSSWRDFRDAVIGAGGLALVAKFALSFIPDSISQKSILVEMVPWASGAAGAGIAWAWGSVHRRAAKNDALGRIIEVEDQLTALLLDRNVGPVQRQRARQLLSSIKLYRATSALEEARTLRQELSRDLEELLPRR
jgi:hypothetical protein